MKSSLFMIFFVLLVVATACYSEIPGNPAGNLLKYYRPLAPWTGLLIMPDPADRQSDGSVWIQVRNSPVRELKGKILRLRWINSEWFDAYRPDVSISAASLEKEKSKGLTLPHRLNGLKKVSALESLAGGRDRDVTEVLLKNPSYRDNSLYIESAPVQISGTMCALVQFRGPAEGELRTVHHFNPVSRKFDPSLSERLMVPVTNTYPKGKDIVTSTVDIEKSALNQDGWYVYGRHIDGVFCVQALEPRKLFQIKPDLMLKGKNDIHHYLGKVHHANLFSGMARKTELRPAESSSGTAEAGQVWKPGAKGFVVHLFGSSLRAGEKTPKIVTGHLSFGIAEVITDPFTGDLRFQIEYKQVYAHTAIGIISGSTMWHCYMGDLTRGWMYALPVTDSIIRIPELDPYDINGWAVSPYEGLQSELERMMAIYRTGAGTGVSDVRPDVSCVQDSNSALYSSLIQFVEKVRNNPKTKAWLSSPDTDPAEVRRFESLARLVDKVRDKLTSFGLLQSNWKSFIRNPLGTRDSGKAKRIIDALLSVGTVFPRRSHDTLLNLAADREYPIWSIYSANIGGVISGLKPLGAQSLLLRK